tara:strand:- start:486 stop:692 length:207 start_codon:yes stop_codon:yes gene_type:complete
MTISDLLSTKMYRNNQSFLARELGVNRTTFRKYMNDTDGEFHFIKGAFDGELELYTNQSNKITQELQA